MSHFNLQTSHPLIKSEQTFVLDRKLISIHSVDRDYKKWPNSNEFGVALGENFKNVQSMRLINFSIPANHYTFANSYENTKLSFTYSLNYPIYLTNFDSANGNYVSLNLFKNILYKLFSPPASWRQDEFEARTGVLLNLASNIGIPAARLRLCPMGYSIATLSVLLPSLKNT